MKVRFGLRVVWETLEIIVEFNMSDQQPFETFLTAGIFSEFQWNIMPELKLREYQMVNQA